MDMQDFETLARLNSLGFQMTWGELKDFAIHVDDTYDCLIAGAESPSDFFKDKSERENFSTCEIVIEAFDSGEWSMWARDEKIMAAFTNPTSGFQPLVL